MAITVCVPMMTLLTRDIMAKMAESVIIVVGIGGLFWARLLAMIWPWKNGAASATITWNLRFFAAC